ncbi:type II secretion system F family protein [Nocardioides euryhalodurans]|uniref:VWA domain-containing protein n=1 Tax=Nocardioides euryhalodurans TaxID=2518370 RepID=A0A4P7GPX5_9ACTN|nr:type II secretion system F family protein [Nocardioides euryhalodurans]QBR94200.1 VWA domain-containing protein [Nocardioides euryhalodurans]
MLARLASGLLAAALSAGVALPAYASPGAGSGDTSIAYVESTDDGLQILVSVPPDATVDVDSVTVSIDGTAADASAAPADSTTEVRRTAVLVVDTSNSMRGDRFAAAQAAALTFLDTVPEDVYVGIVSFDSDVTESLAPSLDRDAARAVVEELELSQQTRLYDGVQAGLQMAGSEGQRQLLVLSDGADTSDTSLDDTTAAITDSEILVNVVGLEQGGAAIDALDALSVAGGGSLINADSEALEQAFNAEADVLARQVLVTAQVPDTITATDATVAVSLGSDTGVLTAEAFTPIGQAADAGGPTFSAPTTGLVLGNTWLYGGLAALGLGLIVLMIALVPRKQRPLTAEGLATSYTDHVTRGSHRAESTQGQSGQVTETAEKVLHANKNLESRIAERLDGAGNPFKPAEWVLVHLAVFLGMGALGFLIGGGNLVVGILFLVLGAVLPWMYLGFKRSRRRKAFERSLPETLQLMSGSLAAGLSLAQSVDTIVREGQDPIASEFRRVLVETRLGISLDDALEGVSDRFDSKDFSWVVMAIRIQRQVGGNLAELLDTVAATMREREYMRRQVAALSAEGKLSAYVLGGLPPAFMLFLFLTKRDYVMVMFTDPLGWLMLGGALTLLAVGSFWMSRLVKVEV